MFLSTVEAVRDRRGMDDTDLVNDAVEAALRSATSILATEVRSTFVELSVVDLFFVRDVLKIGQSMQSKLLTSRGFLKASPVVTVKAAARSQWFTTGDGEVLDLRAIVGVDYTTIDLERGLILITGFDVSDRFIQVAYDCGFATAGTPAVFTGQPDWLVDAAELQASVELEKNPAFRDDEDTDFAAKQLMMQRDAVLGTHIRYEPEATGPVG